MMSAHSHHNSSPARLRLMTARLDDDLMRETTVNGERGNDESQD